MTSHDSHTSGPSSPSDTATPPAVTRLDRRRRGLIYVVSGALLLAVGGWVASMLIESPSEAALNAEPPPPSLITVGVERRQVGEEIVTRGLVTATQTVNAVTPLAGSAARVALVSGKVPKPGDAVEPGGVVTEISGRPVIALQGSVPPYRDLNLGDTGPDVLQLNAALAQAGHATKADSATFDDTTQTALTALYTGAGYSSPTGLPAGEVVFVSTLPASIVSVTAAVGGNAAEASIQIASGELTVAPNFAPEELSRLQAGSEVVISSELLGESADATIQPATGQADGWQVVPNQPLTGQWAGQDVKVRVISAVTESEVLAVPLAAIVANGTGETEVVVVRRGATQISDAEPRRVRVDIGASGGGWVEVTAVDGTLTEGDPVQLSAPTAGG